GYPPTSGAIAWARFLLTRIKLPMIKFRSVDQLLQSEVGLDVKRCFIELGNMINQYEQTLYDRWIEMVVKNLPLYLKQSLLIDAEERPDLFMSNATSPPLNGQGDGQLNINIRLDGPSYKLPLYITSKNKYVDNISSTLQMKYVQKQQNQRSIATKLSTGTEKCNIYQYVLDPTSTGQKIEIKYLVCYDPDLKESLTECKYLETLGYELPDIVQQTTLQHSKFENLSNQLRIMLEDYHLLLASLDTTEVSLLETHLDQLQTALKPGASRISWGEVSASEYVQLCQTHLNRLHSLLNQIRKNSADIQEHLQSFRTCAIDPVVPRHDDGTLYNCRDYFEFIESKRKEIINGLKRRYELIGPLITKVEALVFNTSTGRHKNMRSFYAYWEQEIFHALVELVVKNLCQFNESIHGIPLFIVNVILAQSRIKLQPPMEEISNYIQRSAHGLRELPKHFSRWLHGTCTPCPLPLWIDNDHEHEIPDFTFNNDVQHHPDVTHMYKPRAYIGRIADAINRTLLQWLSYNELWRIDKVLHTNRFAIKNRTYAEYDDIMSIFSKIDQKLDRHLVNKNIYCIELSFKQFRQGLQQHCNDWIKLYGQRLYAKVSQMLKDIDDTIQNLSKGLDHDADTVPDLKFVLYIISQINQRQEELDHNIDEIEQSYRVLHMYNYDYSQTEWNLLFELKTKLKQLIQRSCLVQHRLKPIANRFRNIINYDIQLFEHVINDFVQKFDKQGPNTIVNDLEKSLIVMREFQDDLKRIEQRKIEMINVMKLFNIHITNYPHLARVIKDMQSLQMLFSLYEDFKRNYLLWSNILSHYIDINSFEINFLMLEHCL
ncbi:unnamed protein product, partial [Didymodactylos carnosus]